MLNLIPAKQFCNLLFGEGAGGSMQGLEMAECASTAAIAAVKAHRARRKTGLRWRLLWQCELSRSRITDFDHLDLTTVSPGATRSSAAEQVCGLSCFRIGAK
jgi:hypothetical protein